MNWLSIYNSIIINASKREYNNTIMYEKHHIIPKSIFNNRYSHLIFTNFNIINLNDKNNLVLLTLKEHYFCHLILPKIFIENKDCYIKLMYALNMMISRYCSGKRYEFFKRNFRQIQSDFLKGKPSHSKGCKWTEESKKQKSLTHPLRGKTYDEYFTEEISIRLKKQRSISSTGRKFSDESKQKIINTKKNISDIKKLEINSKIAKANKGKKRTLEQVNKMKDYFSNSIYNKHVDQNWFWFQNIGTKEIFMARKIDMIRMFNVNPQYIITGRNHRCGDFLFLGPCYIRYGRNMLDFNLPKSYKQDFNDFMRTLIPVANISNMEDINDAIFRI